MQYTGNNGQTIEYINNAKATINPNMYCYKLIDGHMRLKGICLGKGWEDWPFNTTQLSCYQKEGEKDMAIIDWSKKWPQAKGMLENGLSLTEIAKALDVDRKMLKSKYDREKRKIAQTPTPEPVQVGSQEPEQVEQEPASISIAEPVNILDLSQEDIEQAMAWGEEFESLAHIKEPQPDWMNRHLVEELQKRWVIDVLGQSLPKAVKMELIDKLLDIEVA